MTQRLVVCFDGTWNDADASTNVLHHFALIQDGSTDLKGIVQRKYYVKGVGTGILDGITGGGFGFGLEKNVREGYNWLLQTYEENPNPDLSDEIYIFGFSRGAYTARSLVGLISTCGLLRRGAPLPVSQLWERYCIIGRQREYRTGMWDSLTRANPDKLRPITKLMYDPWETPGGRPKPAPKPTDDAEVLLSNWSRRVKITYLGIYDTVGAIGFDALAIPGLRSRMAMIHNMRPTTLIQSCRHALALDEHRSSFSHTPFVAYLGAGADEGEHHRDPKAVQKLMIAAAVGDSDPNSVMATTWDDKITQMWFPGAHSNVGGGYANNEIARAPFDWILEGARNCGLLCRPMSSIPVLTTPKSEDSYMQFAPPVWTEIIRAKRFYRRLIPPATVRARAQNGTARRGFALKSINEDIHPTVRAFWNDRPDIPPNLVEALNRELIPLAPEYKARHDWIGENGLRWLALAIWAALVPLGAAALVELATGKHIAQIQSQTLFIWFFAVTAALFVFVDWFESRVNFQAALEPGEPKWKAARDSMYWVRALGVVLAPVGAVSAFCHLWKIGWKCTGFSDLQTAGHLLITQWWPIPAAACLALLILWIGRTLK